MVPQSENQRESKNRFTSNNSKWQRQNSNLGLSDGKTFVLEIRKSFVFDDRISDGKAGSPGDWGPRTGSLLELGSVKLVKGAQLMSVKILPPGQSQERVQVTVVASLC